MLSFTSAVYRSASKSIIYFRLYISAYSLCTSAPVPLFISFYGQCIYSCQKLCSIWWWLALNPVSRPHNVNVSLWIPQQNKLVCKCAVFNSWGKIFLINVWLSLEKLAVKKVQWKKRKRFFIPPTAQYIRTTKMYTPCL